MGIQSRNVRTTVADFYDAVGRKRLQQAGITRQQLSDQKARNQLPTGWYGIVENICEEAGVSIPRHLFSFRKDLSKGVEQDSLDA